MQVEELQEKVLNCFAYILAQNHVQEPGLLAQVLMCMPTLRTISTSYLELTSSSSPTQQWGSWPLELWLGQQVIADLGPEVPPVMDNMQRKRLDLTYRQSAPADTTTPGSRESLRGLLWCVYGIIEVTFCQVDVNVGLDSA